MTDKMTCWQWAQSRRDSATTPNVSVEEALQAKAVVVAARDGAKSLFDALQSYLSEGDGDGQEA